jgi:PKHD-type hydroxylase
MSEIAYPAWNLQLDHVEEYAWYEDALTAEQCDEIINYAKMQNMYNAEVGKDSKISNIRKSKVVFLPPTPTMSPIYARLTDIVNHLNDQFFKFDLFSFGEQLQFTEYNAPDGNYNWHMDRATGIMTRKLSIGVQLSDENDYEGGDFQIYRNEEPINLPRKRGTLLAFPSYIVHRVSDVTKGTRHSLVGWINGKPFK